jgi:hypothetical protein
MRPAEASWRTHGVLVEAGTEPGAILQPSFWGNVAGRLRPLDRIEVMDDAGAWLCVLLVRAVGPAEAVVAELWRREFAPAAMLEQAPAAFEVRWVGHRNRWAVLRAADKSIVREGLQSREEAEEYIRSHVKALAA